MAAKRANRGRFATACQPARGSCIAVYYLFGPAPVELACSPMKAFVVAIPLLTILTILGLGETRALSAEPGTAYDDDPCRVVEVKKIPGPLKIYAPDRKQYLVNRMDEKNVFQVYVSAGDSDQLQCISCSRQNNAPLPQRDKMQANWHPSGKWIIVAGEKERHQLQWLPRQIRQGFAECGIWMDMYATTPDGSRWYKLQEMDGFTGPAFTPDGAKAVWAQAVGPVSSRNRFGKWALKIADFVEREGVPHLENVRDITPANTSWVEPGNFHPNGKDLLLSADTGMSDAQWQDQFVLDISTGHLTNLTNSPRVWDEHGLFSPDGKKIVFMSSYPYRAEKDSWTVFHLKTEFMMMNSDGSDLRQLTHFQVPGYPEYCKTGSTPAYAFFNPEGTQLHGLRLLSGKQFPGYDFWEITFSGHCGNLSTTKTGYQ